MRACGYASTAVWLDPKFAALVEPVLPKKDTARWPMLAWESVAGEHPTLDEKERSSQTNRAMARLYCPQSFDILDMVTTPDMWSNRKTIAACMARFLSGAALQEATLDVNGLLDGPLESDNYESHA